MKYIQSLLLAVFLLGPVTAEAASPKGKDFYGSFSVGTNFLTQDQAWSFDRTAGVSDKIGENFRIDTTADAGWRVGAAVGAWTLPMLRTEAFIGYGGYTVNFQVAYEAANSFSINLERRTDQYDVFANLHRAVARAAFTFVDPDAPTDAEEVMAVAAEDAALAAAIITSNNDFSQSLLTGNTRREEAQALSRVNYARSNVADATETVYAGALLAYTTAEMAGEATVGALNDARDALASIIDPIVATALMAANADATLTAAQKLAAVNMAISDALGVADSPAALAEAARALAFTAATSHLNAIRMAGAGVFTAAAVMVPDTSAGAAAGAMRLATVEDIATAQALRDAAAFTAEADTSTILIMFNNYVYPFQAFSSIGGIKVPALAKNLYVGVGVGVALTSFDGSNNGTSFKDGYAESPSIALMGAVGYEAYLGDLMPGMSKELAGVSIGAEYQYTWSQAKPQLSPARGTNDETLHQRGHNVLVTARYEF